MLPRPYHVAWPDIQLSEVPEDDEAVELAEWVRRQTLGQESEGNGRLDFAVLARSGYFDVEQRPLGAAERGLEGVLVPRRDKFDVVVDPEPPGGWVAVEPGRRPSLRRHRARFRTAHELGHMFFYRRGADGFHRVVPSSQKQEDFCDAFARALLVPPDEARRVAPTVTGVLSLHRRFDVSVELAARSLSHAHPTVAFWLILTRSQRRSRAELQWRSRSSYGSSMATEEVLRRVDETTDLGLAADAGALSISLLEERNQALAFL